MRTSVALSLAPLLLAGQALLPTAQARAAVPAHPLDTLSAEEIEEAVAILRAAGHVDDATRYAEIGLLEPAKATVLAWKPGMPVPRSALAVALDRTKNESHEGVVDLVADRVVSWKRIAEGQPMILMAEYDEASEAVRKDPAWRAAMARRGITDPDAVYLDTWAPGEVELDRRAVPRLARVLSFNRGTQKNPYGPPIEGVIALVDLNTLQVLDVHDSGLAPLSTQSTDYYDAAVTGTRAALKPLVTSMPDGPGFGIHGHEVTWDRWQLRWSMNAREGLVLHQITWADGEHLRPVLYRASLSEMVVPYADPAGTWAWRSAFDEGEYGLGRLSVPLERGMTAPGHATLLDAVFAGDTGTPEDLRGGVAVYERDGGLLWYHYDMEHGAAARRARELVIQSIATIGNYDYCIQWVFQQDGAIALELILSGSLLTKGVVSARCETCRPAGGSDTAWPRGDQRNGTLVAENVVAPHHQHFVNVRLDFDVDGTENDVKEVNVHRDTASRNPAGNAFVAVPTWLRSERRARRHVAAAAHRTWEVASLSATNAQGHPTAYALLPGAASLPYPGTRSPILRRGAFATSAFHATRFHDDEFFAAGPYPNQNAGVGGLTRWIKDDEPLRGDVVVWYTIGVTHVARPEEYPIMNATKIGFRLAPVGFFAMNPGLDVPAP